VTAGPSCQTHEVCRFCDQEKTTQHLLVGCFHNTDLVPDPPTLQLDLPGTSATDDRFSNWWRKALSSVPKEMKKGLNSLIIIVSREV
jgi:hypothetical protein